MAAALLASISAPVALSVGHAQAKSAATLRQEARQILAQINANGERISVLDEQINGAQLRLTSLQAQIRKTSASIASAQHTIDSLHSAVVARAAALYRGAGGATDLGPQSASTVQAQGAMQMYTQAAAAQDQLRIDQYRNARDARTRAKATLDAAEKSQQQQLDSLRANEHQIASLNASEQRLYNQTNSELKNAIVAEQNAAIARARAEAAAKAQAARAASDAASSNNGGLTNTNTGVAPGPVPAPSAGAATAVSVAESKIGDWYVYAASGPNTFDCSGLTMFAWAAAGVYLPHSADAQYRMLPSIPVGQAQPGDLAFFGSQSYVHHVGIVVGGGEMVEASHTGTQIHYASYFRPDLVGIGRP